MNWTQILTELFQVVLLPLIGVGTTYLVVFIKNKTKEIKNKTDNELLKSHLDMLNDIIIDCVKATSQTYVEDLKKQGRFDTEAQVHALQETYNNIMKILAVGAKEYLEVAIGDLKGHILNKIEAQVGNNKKQK